VLLYPVAVAVHLARGDPDEAEQVCRRVEEATTWFHSRAWIATAHEARGLLARAEGKRVLAADHLEQARAALAGLGQARDEARCFAAPSPSSTALPPGGARAVVTAPAARGRPSPVMSSLDRR
jgi:hypothetical protein